MVLDERGQLLAQVGTHQHLAGHAGNVIAIPGKSLCVLATIPRGVWLLLLERVGRANDRTMLVVHRHGAQADRNLVSGFVLQKTNRLCRLGCLDGSSTRGVLVDGLASRAGAMQE